MKNYGSYVQNITQNLANLRLQAFRSGGTKEGGIPNQMFNALKNFGSKVVGQDGESKARRRGFIESRRDKRKTSADVTMDDARAAPGVTPQGQQNIGSDLAGTVPTDEAGVIRIPPTLRAPGTPPTGEDTGTAPPPSGGSTDSSSPSGRRRR